jgi:4-hydroxybenzoate polyprenyltransferase
MSTKNKILEYLRLMRPQAAAQTVTILLLGSLIMGQRDFSSLLILFIIGILSHIHGFVLNDYADIEVDKKLSELGKKPLVSGVIPKRHALIITVITAICAYVITIMFFLSKLSLILLTSAAILNGIYNIYGKKFPGSDFILSGGLALFCLFGASTVSTHFTNVVYIISLLLFVEGIFLNAVEGGVKDVAHDYLAKAKTLATVMGVKVKNGRLLLTKKFMAFAYSLKIIYFGLILLLGFQPEINLWHSDNYALIIIVIFLIILIIITFHKFLYLKMFDRSKIKKLYAGLNATTLALIFVMLVPIFGFVIVLILLFLPVMWYTVFNFILYGKPLQPRV